MIGLNIGLGWGRGGGPNADAVTLTAVDHLTSGQQSVILAEGWVEVG